MSLLKDAIIETIIRMPESTTAIDIIYEIVIIDRAIEDLKVSGKELTITAEELLEKIGRWPKQIV